MYTTQFFALLIFFLGLFALPHTRSLQAASVTPRDKPALIHGKMPSTSTFEYLDVQDGALAQQIIIKAANSITCKKYIDNEKHQFVLDIAGLTLNSLDQETIRKKIDLLLSKGYINRLDLEPTEGSTRFILTFAANRQVINTETNSYEETTNSILIRSCAYEKQFTIDIYTKGALEDILQKTNTFIRLADNGKETSTAPLFAMNQPNLAPMRIMIDAGHGGSDTGAKSYSGLTEKEVTLDISKRVHHILKSKKYPAYLTRYHDTEVPLAQRAQLATQMQANLFVSIHANGAVNPNAHGIETYFFPAKELRSRKNFDFLFINQPKNIDLVKKIQQNVSLMAQDSFQLAQSIQRNVISGLSATYPDMNNRGIKSESFRLFLQNTSIPSALVEVGFLTNRKEADRLAQKSYRKHIAQHIADGISSFIEANKQSAAA